MPPRVTLRLVASCVLLAAALSLFSCYRGTASETPGMLTFLIESMPQNLDPRFATDAESQHLDSLMFDSLVALDDRMEVVPDLAERWETPDPLTYVFHLRPGVRFQDGRALTSADVKFTFESILNGEIVSPKRGAFRMVHSIETPDASTIIFHLNSPYASFLWSMARPAIGIIPAGAGGDFASHPIGTGPFRFLRAVPDEEVVLARNPSYFGPPPPLAEIQFRVVPDATTRALELRKGSADMALNSLTADTVEALRRDPSIEVTDAPGASLDYLVINCQAPALRDRRVRQALAYATDRDTLIRYLLRGEARPAYSLLPPDHWAYNASLPHYNYNPALAVKLLDAAGFAADADGIRLHLSLKISTEERARLVGAALQDEWRRAGIVLELRPLEFATLYADVTRGSFALAFMRWVGANSDPDIYDYVFNSRRIPPEGANRGHYRNAQVDSLLQQEREEMNPAKRQELLLSLQSVIAQDLPYITLWFPDNLCVYQKRIHGVAISPSGDYDFLLRVSAD